MCHKDQASRLANELMCEQRKPLFDASLSHVASREHGCVTFLGVNESQRTVTEDVGGMPDLLIFPYLAM